MKTTRIVSILAGITCVSAVVVALVGCDVSDAKSASEPITVEPASAVLAKGQSQEFTASGGYDYRWTLSDQSVGVLNPRTGNRVVFTALKTGISSNALQTTVSIIVTSTIDGASPSSVDNSTNGVDVSRSYRATAEALVTIK
jgi:hypothetical protein